MWCLIFCKTALNTASVQKICRQKTQIGRTRKADLNICKWIIESWNDIPSELISKSFRKCCITNALDGTEDDDIRQEDDDCDPFNDEDGGDDLYYAKELD